MDTRYSDEMYCLASSVYGTTDSTAISTPTGKCGPSTELEEVDKVVSYPITIYQTVLTDETKPHCWTLGPSRYILVAYAYLVPERTVPCVSVRVRD